MAAARVQDVFKSPRDGPIRENRVSVRIPSIVAAMVAVAVLAAPAATASEERALASQQCADADLEPSPDNLDRVRAAIVCLHNEVRAEHGLPALREHARLRRAAVGHSRDMVADRFFEHTTPAGVTMVERILRARYVRRNQGWALGENLAWGTGSLATARGAVRAWMGSPGHRANILRRTYRELGVGIVLGVPVSDAAGATYTVDFGVRR
jgi:uncharacterized protein YkwD